MTPSARGALAAAIVGSATVFLDGTIVNVALPRIGASLPAVAIGVLEGQVYIVAGYMATLAAFLLLAGALGDRYGRRRMFLVGLIGFGLASMVCAPGAVPRRPRRRPPAPGRGRCPPGPGVAGHHHGGVRRPGSRSGLRNLGRLDVGRRGLRAARRRCARGAVRLAQHLPGQPAVGDAGRRPHGPLRAGSPRHGHETVRLARRDSWPPSRSAVFASGPSGDNRSRGPSQDP